MVQQNITGAQFCRAGEMLFRTKGLEKCLQQGTEESACHSCHGNSWIRVNICKQTKKEKPKLILDKNLEIRQVINNWSSAWQKV